LVAEANPAHCIEPATPAMTDDRTPPFSFPAVRGRKLTAAFDGGRLSSDGGVMLLAAAARRTGIAQKLAAVIPDSRDRTRVVHPLAEILLARILAIACGYEDADDLDTLRTDPAFELACGRLPGSGADLMRQPTVSRWENAPGVRDLVGLGRVMVELHGASYVAPAEAVVLDIDDTVDVVPVGFADITPWDRAGSPPATSKCRSSMRTTTNAAACRSTSTIRRPAVRWP
jgi:Transposase DDE domain group 1